MMPARALVAGIVALLVTFILLRLVWFALYASVGGLMLAAVIAHAVGTAVAMVLDLPTGQRTLRRIARRVGIAATCGVLLWFLIRTLYTWVVLAAPALYRQYGGFEAILTAAAVYALFALVLGRVEPAWPRYAGPLAIVVVVVTTLMVMALTSYHPPASVPGGANQPDVPSRGGPTRP